MDRKLIPWIAVALVVPAIVTLIVSKDVWEVALYGILSFCCFPIAVMGVYMWSTGEGWRWTNGIDWYSMSEDRRRGTASRVGLYMTVSMAVLLMAVPVLLSNILLGLVLIAVGTVIILIPFVYRRNDSFDPPTNGRMKSILGVAAVSILCLAIPFIPTGSSGTVSMEFGEESFRVTAPMFDHTFRYDEVDEAELYPDFDKGKRRMGFGTPDIMSGKFENDMFGRYELASYAKVKPCIAISVDGDIYAFNQESDAATQACYNELLSRLP